MRSYCRLKTGLAGFFLLYLIVGLFGMLLPNKEVFPIYSWLFFPIVPNPGYHYDVLILQKKGEAFYPPLSYNDAGGVVTSARNIRAYQFIQKMGRTRARGDLMELEELNRLFQRDFLKAGTSYQLVRIYYDPIERWHGKKSPAEVLETFSPAASRP